jgi:hypothetical protein
LPLTREDNEVQELAEAVAKSNATADTKANIFYTEYII